MTTTSIQEFKFKPNLKKRIIATLLDYSLFLLPTFIYIMVFGHNDNDGGKTVSGLLALPIFIFWFIYFVIIESIYGATLSHQAFCLKVLTVSRKKIGLTEALKRHLLDPVDIFFYGIVAIIVIKNTEKHQRVGDLWAKTVVIDISDSEQYLP